MVNDKSITYYDGWCEPKFNETHRSKARKELAQDEKSNSLDIQKMFHLIESDYFASGKNLIGKVPPKFVADAIIDTIEYAQKLTRLSELEKIVKKQKIQHLKINFINVYHAINLKIIALYVITQKVIILKKMIIH